MGSVTLRNLDPRTTVYGSQISINTNYAACNAKEHSRKQRNSPRYDRSQNPSISPEHDLTYDVITSGPNISGGQYFKKMCQIDQCEDTESFVEMQRVLCYLFTENYWWGFVRPPPPTCARVKSFLLPTHSLIYDKSRVGRIFKHHLRFRIIYIAPVTPQYTPKIRS